MQNLLQNISFFIILENFLVQSQLRPPKWNMGFLVRGIMWDFFWWFYTLSPIIRINFRFTLFFSRLKHKMTRLYLYHSYNGLTPFQVADLYSILLGWEGADHSAFVHLQWVSRNLVTTAQKLKFSIKDFFSKYNQIYRTLENFIFCVVYNTSSCLPKCHTKKNKISRISECSLISSFST